MYLKYIAKSQILYKKEYSVFAFLEFNMITLQDADGAAAGLFRLVLYVT